MSTSAEHPILTVNGDDDAELYVIDGALQTVAYGVSTISQPLPQGLYKVRAVRGGTSREQLVELSDAPLTVPLWVQEFDAIAPIMPVFGAHYAAIEHHAQRAIQLGSAKPIAGDTGAPACRLLVLGHMAASTQGGDPLARMRLFPWRQVADRQNLDCDVPPEPIGDQIWRGWFRACGPGCHVLELHDGAQWVRQAVLVASGWETRVFVRRAAAARPEISIQMAPPGSPVVYNDQYQTVEVARRALETNRPIIVRDNLVDDLLFGKFYNPVMGLTGLHLFLEALERRDLPKSAHPRRVDLSGEHVKKGREIVREVIGNLHKLLRGGGMRPPHEVSLNELTESVPADLAGLENRAARFLDPASGPSPLVDHPPMFWASWTALRDAPSDSARYAVQQDLWTKTAHSIAAGPYYSWQPKRVSLSGFVESAVETAMMSTMATPLALSPGFAAQIMGVAPTIASGKALRASRRGTTLDLGDSRADIGKALGIPDSLIEWM